MEGGQRDSPLTFNNVCLNEITDHVPLLFRGIHDRFIGFDQTYALMTMKAEEEVLKQLSL